MIFLVAVLGAACFPSSGFALDRLGHNEFGRLLLGTPARRGGLGSMSLQKLDSVNKWMDYPSTQTGEYTVSSTGRPVNPRTHGNLRHNPIRTAKALSGNGQVSQETLNAARMHKVSDVAHNKALVDGWEITPEMKKQALAIEDHVSKDGRLPEKLPEWVDKSQREFDGDDPTRLVRTRSSVKALALRGVKVIAVTTVVSGSINGYRWASGDISGSEAIANVGTDDAAAGSAWLATEGTVAAVGDHLVLAVKTGAGVGVAYIAFQGTRDVINALRGKINPNDLPERMMDTGIKGAAAGVTTGVIIAACSNPGTAIIVLSGLGTVVTVDYAYPKIKALFDGRARARDAYYSRLPDEMKQVCPLEWVREERPLEKFGKSWGPKLGRPKTDLSMPKGEPAKSAVPALW